MVGSHTIANTANKDMILHKDENLGTVLHLEELRETHVGRGTTIQEDREEEVDDDDEEGEIDDDEETDEELEEEPDEELEEEPEEEYDSSFEDEYADVEQDCLNSPRRSSGDVHTIGHTYSPTNIAAAGDIKTGTEEEVMMVEGEPMIQNQPEGNRSDGEKVRFPIIVTIDRHLNDDRGQTWRNPLSYTCSACSMTFTTATDIGRHIAEVHSKNGQSLLVYTRL